MLLMVVAVFLFCNVLPFVNNFMESMDIPMSLHLIDISNFLVAVNSSVNCFIYCIFGTKFRKEFLYLVKYLFPCLKSSFTYGHGQTVLTHPHNHLGQQANHRRHSDSPKKSEVKYCAKNYVTSKSTAL